MTCYSDAIRCSEHSQILRTQLNCSLPVEIAYIGEKKELQPEHIATLDAKLGPVYGLDLSMLPYPKHHNP